MKRFLSGLAMFCTILSTITMVHAAPIVQDTSNGSVQIEHHEILGQSFTAEDTYIDTIGAWVIGPYNERNDLTLTMNLWAGDGDFSTDALLYTEEFTLSSSNYNGWLDMDVSSLLFDVGTQYTFTLDNDTPQWGVAYNNGGNPYTGGDAYLYSTRRTDADLQFRVLPSANQNPVPEPGTMLLVGTGLFGLIGFGIRRKKR